MNTSISPSRGVTADAAAAARDRPRRGPSVGPAALVVALGVFVQAEIGYVGRTSGAFSAPLYFLSLCAIYTPAVVLAVSRSYSNNARVWFTLYSCVAQLVSRFMLYPDLFVYHDEIIHQQVEQSIYSTGHLFKPDWILPVVPYYPGSEIATSAVQQLTKLPFHAAAMLVLIVVRVIMILALIRIVARISHSVTVACVAALIFACNPQFIFFYSLFSYQSVALPLALFAVYLFSIRRPALGLAGLGPTAAVVAAVAVTHHLTSLGLVVFFWAWWLISVATKQPVRQLLSISLISTVIVAAWTWVARSEVIPYISQVVATDWSSVLGLIEGKSVKHFFTDSADYHAAVWEIVLSLVAVLMTVAALVPSLWRGFRLRKTTRASGLVLVLIAAGYAIWPLGHLPPAAAEAADRSAPFIFVGVSYVVARWYYDRFLQTGSEPRPEISRAWAGGALSAGLSVCLVGNTIIGTGPNWSYSPGPYLVEADSRSIDSLALSAAYWEAANVPRDSRTFADRDNALLAQTYGHLRVLTAQSSKIPEGTLSVLLLSGSAVSDIGIACRYDMQYLVADRRLATSLPHLSEYIDRGEYLDGIRTAPPPASALTKFDYVPGAERIYDNGAIRIYDLKGLECAGQR